MGKRFVERQWSIAITPGNGEYARLSAAAAMNIDCAACRDFEAVRGDGLKARLIDPGSDRALDLAVQQSLEGGEQRVLQIDPSAPTGD